LIIIKGDFGNARRQAGPLAGIHRGGSGQACPAAAWIVRSRWPYKYRMLPRLVMTGWWLTGRPRAAAARLSVRFLRERLVLGPVNVIYVTFLGAGGH